MQIFETKVYCQTNGAKLIPAKIHETISEFGDIGFFSKYIKFDSSYKKTVMNGTETDPTQQTQIVGGTSF